LFDVYLDIPFPNYGLKRLSWTAWKRKQHASWKNDVFLQETVAENCDEN
jgi:hypothetical protein